MKGLGLGFYDLAPLLIITVHFLMIPFLWDVLPSGMPDTPYHLLMGKMFSDHGRVCLWDYYEYAPEGRPNLYPPLLHVIIWLAHDATGVDYWTIGKAISALQYPLSLLAIWLFARTLYGKAVGAYSTVFASTVMRFWWQQASVAPSSTIAMLLPLYMIAVFRRSQVGIFTLLTSFLYLHLGFPLVIILCTVIYAVIIRDRGILKPIIASFVVYLPWLFHLWTYRSWIGEGVSGMRGLRVAWETNLLYLSFTILGVVIAIIKLREKRYNLTLVFSAGMLAVLFAYGFRYFYHSPPVNSVLAGIGALWIGTAISKKLNIRRDLVYGLLLVGLACLTFTKLPYLHLRPGIGVHMGDSITCKLLDHVSGDSSFPYGWKWNDDPYLPLIIKWIEENTMPNTIIHTRSGILGDYLALLSDRRTSTGMFAEVKPDYWQRKIKPDGGIFIFTEEEYNRIPQQVKRNVRIEVEFGPYLIGIPRV